jgi:hypothetical protein
MKFPLTLSFSTATALELLPPSPSEPMPAPEFAPPPASQSVLSRAQRSARARRSAANVLARLERFISASGLCSIVAVPFPFSRRARGAGTGVRLGLGFGLAIRSVLGRDMLRRTGA